MTPRQTVAINIMWLRTQRKLSQQAVASRSGLHRSYMSSVERAERNIEIDTLFKIAKALRVVPGALLEPVEDFASAKWLPVKAAAKRLGLCRQTIYHGIKTGRFKATKNEYGTIVVSGMSLKRYSSDGRRRSGYRR